MRHISGIQLERDGRTKHDENIADASGDRPSAKASEKGCQVGLLIVNLLAEKDLITEEYEGLREWFNNEN